MSLHSHLLLTRDGADVLILITIFPLFAESAVFIANNDVSQRLSEVETKCIEPTMTVIVQTECSFDIINIKRLLLFCVTANAKSPFCSWARRLVYPLCHFTIQFTM